MIDIDVGGERRWESGQSIGYSDPMREDVRVEEDSESRAVKSGVGLESIGLRVPPKR